MATTGFTAAGAGANIAGAFELSWANTANITASDDSDANVNSWDSDESPSQSLYADQFSFALPSGATVDGIEVRFERANTASGSDVTNDAVQLVNAAAAIAGNNLGASTAWPTTDATDTKGGASELWGLTPTEADVEDVDWGFIVRAANAGESQTSTVDFMEMNIHYTAAGGGAVPHNPLGHPLSGALGGPIG